MNAPLQPGGPSAKNAPGGIRNETSDEPAAAGRMSQLAAENLALRREALAAQQAKDSLEFVNGRLHQLSEAVQELGTAKDMDGIVRVTRMAARRLVGADGVTVVLRDGNLCHYVDEDAIAPLWKGQRFPLESCISGWVMLHDAPAVITDIYTDSRIPVDAYRPTFVKSLMMLPMRIEQPLGAVGCYWARPHTATAQEQQLIGLLADAAARAIDSVRRMQEMERQLAIRQSAEQVTQGNLRLFEAIVETTPSLVVLCDAQGRILLFNRACEDLTGYDRAEVLGRTIAELFLPPEWVPVVARRFANPLAPEVRQPHRNPWRTKPGQLKLIEWRCTVLPSSEDGSLGVLGTGIDITEQQRIEDELREAEQNVRVSEERLRLMVENVTEHAIFMLDPAGHVVSWNAGAGRIKGYSADEIIGKHFSVFYPREAIAEGLPAKMLARALAAGHARHEGWRVRQDGSRFWGNVSFSAVHDATGNHCGFVQVTQDNTERREAHEALRNSKQVLQSIFDAAPVAVLGFDLEGRTTSWSAGAERMFGWTSQEALGRVCPTVPPECLADFHEMIRRVARQGPETLVRVRRKKSGELIYARLHPAPLCGPEGGANGAMVILEDITEEHRKDESLRQLAASLTEERRRLVEAQIVAKVGSWDIALPDMKVSWSDEVYRIFESDPACFIPTYRDFLARIHPEDRAKVDGAFNALLRGRGACVVEHRICLPEGRIKIVEERWRMEAAGPGEPGRIAGTCQDITERRQVDEELLAYQRQYETLFRQSPIAICLSRLDDGCLIDVNNKLLQLFGCNRDDVIGRVAAELDFWVDPAEYRRVFRLAAQGGRVENLEAHLRRKSGDAFAALISIERLHLNGEDLLVSMLIDVTERNLAWHKLSVGSHRQTSLATLSRHALANGDMTSLIGEGIQVLLQGLDLRFCAVIELRPDSRTGRLVAGAGGTEQVPRPGDVIDLDPLALFTLQHPDPVVVEDLQTESRFAVPESMRNQGIRSGLSLVIGAQNRPWGILGGFAPAVRKFAVEETAFAQSIADLMGTAIGRSLAERAAQESAIEQRLIATATNDMLWRWDFATGQIIRNEGFQAHLGYAPQEIRPDIDWWFERVHPEDLERVTGDFRMAQKTGRDGCRYQYRFRKHDGNYAVIDDRVCFLRDPSGQVVRALGAMTDITERLEQQAAIRRISRELLVAEETERRRIAKELHDSTVQDLVAAMINLELFREQRSAGMPPGPALLQDSLALMEKCAHDIRTLSYRLHPPRLDEAGLVGAIEHYVKGFGDRTGIEMRVHLSAELCRLDETVEMVLFRVLQECLGNIHRHAGSRTATVRLEQGAGEIVLQISDEGTGMPRRGTTAASQFGVGIPGMRERLSHVDGRLEIDSGDRGTIVRAVVPCRNHA